MKVFLIAAAILAGIHAAPITRAELQQWDSFKVSYGKKYSNQTEEKLRRKVFLENLRKYAEHNKEYEAGRVSYRKGINQFADMTHEEFVATLNGLVFPDTPVNATLYVPPAGRKIFDFVDWRQLGIVTRVKNQGHCGTCWSFSATGALEGQLARKTGRLVSLSEQNLVDCSRSYGNGGCTKGGWPSKAFEYIRDNGGIDTERSYPYEDRDGCCRYNSRNSAGTTSGPVMVSQGNEAHLHSAISIVGPISVAIDASGIKDYTGGVYDNPNCNSENLNHAVLVVGYGTDENGRQYYIVKNSWGKYYGENGYIRMSRNKNNQCGIASEGVYPKVD